MRDIERNKQPLYYRLYLESDGYILDNFGNPTGEPDIKYGVLQSCNICISANKGADEAGMFGTMTDYDRTMTTSDITVPINENAVLWVDYGKIVDYEQTSEYAIGDFCIYNDAIYRCVREVDEGEEWTPSHWTFEPYNFVVKKRAPWKNSIAFAIKDVDVSV